MAKAKKRQRITRKELKQPDEFVTTTVRLYQYAEKHRRSLVAGLVVLVALVAGGMVADSWMTGQAHARSEQFAEAIELMARPAGVGPAADAQPQASTLPTAEAAPGVPPKPSFESPAKRSEAVVQALEAFADGPAKLSALAQVGRASAYMDAQRIDDAIVAYRAFINSGVQVDLRLFGYDGLVSALLAKGEHGAALVAGEELGGLADGRYAEHAAYSRAWVLEHKGDADQARAAYRSFVEKYPASLLLDRAQTRLQRLGG